jgi:hypothetical protein
MDTQTSFVARFSCKTRWLALMSLVLASGAFAAVAASSNPTLGFINELSDPVGSGFGLARMESSVCFRVHNAPDAMTDYLQQRMATTAAATNIAVQQPGCVPNVDVVFTHDARATARDFIRQQPQLIRPFGNVAGTTQGTQALNEFARLDVPVRWWQTTVQVDWNGDVAMNLPQSNSIVPVAGVSSHFTQGVRDRLLHSLILVEIGKLGDTSWDQLADYLAMVALVQVNPHAQLAGHDSILNLFDSGKPPAGLTAWDSAYLSSLYSINRHLYPHAQQGQLAEAMQRILQKDQLLFASQGRSAKSP